VAEPSCIQVERDFELKWRLSFRAAGAISSVARAFHSSVQIVHGDASADAKSILGLSTLGSLESPRPLFGAGETSALCVRFARPSASDGNLSEVPAVGQIGFGEGKELE
jgi:hypothetical protein